MGNPNDSSDEPASKKSRTEAPTQLSKDVENKLTAALSTQEELEKLHQEATNEVLAVEQKYSKLKKPLFEKRDKELKHIPGFWSTAFQNHPVIAQLMMELDQQILSHVTELEIEDLEDIKTGFKISMRFSENEFFSNDLLVKTLKYDLSKGDAKTECTEVNWKPGQEEKVTDASNLFMWFTATESLDDGPDEVASQIKDSLYMDAIRFFKNELTEEEMYNRDMDDMEGIGESDDDDDEDGDGGSDGGEEDDEEEEA